ncbi:zinc ion binding [Striga asiatica]|uniref:Zinc ion binding n=1 Tax=Striga asiatica TaxID=4170 RepID=A0A5A7PX98_STRAF|nr:zinc ion binding [Striga asiatica]
MAAVLLRRRSAATRLDEGSYGARQGWRATASDGDCGVAGTEDETDSAIGALESEETVKEILVKVVSELDERVNTLMPPENKYLNGAVLMLPPPAIQAEPDLHGKNIVSGISEICSFRESFPSNTNGGAIARGAAAVENRQTAMQMRKVAAVRWRREGWRLMSPMSRGDGKSEMVCTREPRNDVVPEEEAESLENPIVSLECFIFL